MGGDYYTRAVGTTNSSTGASAAAAKAFSVGIQDECLPRKRLTAIPDSQPVIIAFDVTGRK